MQHALFLPIFGELADPAVVAQLSVEAEESGWSGIFVWDHVAYAAPVRAIADPWVTLAAVAARTSKVRLGPMVTPLPRRRPLKLAREVATLDILSEGRFVLGVGIGDDGAGEFSGSGEEIDPRVRGAMLDEALAVVTAAWSGELVRHRGEHYVLDGLRVEPRPQQRPHPPVWVAMRRGNPAPLRRAARYDGVFPIGVESPADLQSIVTAVHRSQEADGVVRSAAHPYDVVVNGSPDTDWRPYEDAGATWWLTSFSPYDVTAAAVRDVIARAS
jgi:alkanesulfonate monooxygenase SsuD/methylene tetrahydromethanopterin reductase-like flavin-dependent oxidoreductase (luciferase family)